MNFFNVDKYVFVYRNNFFFVFVGILLFPSQNTMEIFLLRSHSSFHTAFYKSFWK